MGSEEIRYWRVAGYSRDADVQWNSYMGTLIWFCDESRTTPRLGSETIVGCYCIGCILQGTGMWRSVLGASICWWSSIDDIKLGRPEGKVGKLVKLETWQRIQPWPEDVKTGKTKIMIGEEINGDIEKLGKWPCCVCIHRVGTNSMKCTECMQWICKKYNGI